MDEIETADEQLLEESHSGDSIAVGNTIDFKVGANGNFYSDSTGLHGYIQRDEP